MNLYVTGNNLYHLKVLIKYNTISVASQYDFFNAFSSLFKNKIYKYKYSNKFNIL